MFLKEHLEFDNLTFLTPTCPGLWSNVKTDIHNRILHTSQVTRKTCVTRHIAIFFIRWPHFAGPWPSPVLSISPVLAWYLRSPLSWALAEFGFADVFGLILAVDKAKKVSFDL